MTRRYIWHIAMSLCLMICTNLFMQAFIPGEFCTPCNDMPTSYPTGGTDVDTIVISPNGKFLVTTNSTSNTLSGFGVSSCSLSDPPPFNPIPSVGLVPRGAAFSPDGSYLVVANSNSGTLTTYSADQNIYFLAPILIQPTVPSGGLVLIPTLRPQAVAITSNNCVFVTNIDSATPSNRRISIFTLDPTTGILTFVSNVIPVYNPVYSALSSDGQCFAVSHPNDNRISTYRVSGCSLTHAQTIQVGTTPQRIAFSPTSNCLGVTNSVDNTVSIFAVNSDCTLTPTQTIETHGIQPTGITFSQNGKCLSVGNALSGNVALFNVDQTSCTSNFLTTTSPGSTLNSGSVIFLANGNCIAINSNTTNTINVFTFLAINLTPSQQTVPFRGNATFSTDIFGGVSSFTYSWTGPNGFTADTPSITITDVTEANAGTYMVTVTDSATVPCVRTASALLNVSPNPIAAPIVTLFPEVSQSLKPIIVGTVQPGIPTVRGIITTSTGEEIIATTSADGAGNWTFTPPADLDPGTYTFNFIAVDQSGNESAPSTPISVIVNPAAPTIVSLSQIAPNVLGGNAPIGTTVFVFADDRPIGSTIAANGTWRFPLEGILTNGTYTFNVIGDIPNDITFQPVPITGTIVNTNLAAPIVTLFPEVSQSPRPIIVGTAQPSTPSNPITVTGFITTPTGQIIPVITPVDNLGNWIVVPPVDLDPGTYTFTFIARDALGNTSPSSIPVTVVVNPDASSIVTLRQESSNILTGIAPANTVISVFANNKFIGTTTAGVDGTWHFSVEGLLTNGTYTFGVIGTFPDGSTFQPFTIVASIVNQQLFSALSIAIHNKYRC